jgi:hypothetical protein
MTRWKCLSLGAAVVAALVVSAIAAAAGPEITRFTVEDSYVDTQTCPGIRLDTRLQGRVTVQAFSETRVQVHSGLVYTVTADGKTFTDNESFTEFANPETGVVTLAGTAINIQIPGYGNLLADRGTITIDFSTDPWTVIHEGGPHPFFHGGYTALCAYLAS